MFACIRLGMITTRPRSSSNLVAAQPGMHTCLRCVACSIIRESAWQLELKGDVTRQRRLEAVDKLMSVLTLVRCGRRSAIPAACLGHWTRVLVLTFASPP